MTAAAAQRRGGCGVEQSNVGSSLVLVKEQCDAV
jgi:hypothetical protein